jgi:hypothetical protein
MNSTPKAGGSEPGRVDRPKTTAGEGIDEGDEISSPANPPATLSSPPARRGLARQKMGVFKLVLT